MELDVREEMDLLYHGKNSKLKRNNSIQISNEYHTILTLKNDREKKLLKDRIRKQIKNKKIKDEINELKNKIYELENKIILYSNGKKNIDIIKKYIKNSYELQNYLKNQLIIQLEKGILYQSLLYSSSNSNTMMILDPRRDPWMYHTLPADPTTHYYTIHTIMTQQLAQFTPELACRFPTTNTESPFSIVLDQYGQDMSFLEMKKYGLIRGSSMDIMNAIFSSIQVDYPRESNCQLTIYDNKFALCTQRIPNGPTIHRITSLHIDTNRIILLFRGLHYDADTSTYSPEVHAGWFVCENLPTADGSPLSILKGYTQVLLDTTRQQSTQAYAQYMTRSTKSNAFLNQLLQQFDPIELN